MLLKYNLGGLPGSVASEGGYLSQEAEQPWKATVQHALSFGSVLRVMLSLSLLDS